MDSTGSFRKEWLVVGALLMLFTAALSPQLPGFEWDVFCWRSWSAHMTANGLNEAYSKGDNSYPPLYNYILWGFGKLNGDHDTIWHNIGYLRIISLLFEYWALWMVYRWLDRRIDLGFLLVCTILNVGYSYNIIFWEQVDGIMAAMVFAAFFNLARQRLLLSAAMLVLSLNMKLQAIIYIPLWGVLMCATLHRAGRWRQAMLIIPWMIALQALIVLPFAFGTGGLGAFWRTVAGLPDAFSTLSMSAYNMWYWIADGDPSAVRDDIRMLGMTAKQLGLLSFCTASFFAMLPVLSDTWMAFRGEKQSRLSRETIWLSAILVSLAFFFFNTRMHERYAHGAFIFLIAYAFRTKRYGLYALFSLTYLLNLERVLRAFRLRNYDTLLFDPRFIAAMYAACFVWGLILLYRQWRNAATEKAIIADLQPSQA